MRDVTRNPAAVEPPALSRRLLRYPVARRPGACRRALPAALHFQFHFRCGRDQRLTAREPRRVPGLRLPSARPGRRVRAHDRKNAVWRDLQRAVRHRADGRLGARRLPRRSCARIRRRCGECAVHSEWRVSGPAGGNRIRQSASLVSGLSAGRARRHRRADRSRCSGRLSAPRRHRRCSGRRQSRKSGACRLYLAAAPDAEACARRTEPSALAVRHRVADIAPSRHALLREFERRARHGGVFERRYPRAPA